MSVERGAEVGRSPAVPPCLAERSMGQSENLNILPGGFFSRLLDGDGEGEAVYVPSEGWTAVEEGA